ncbi:MULTISPECIES: quaternary amine ABC transporter ATP-binding protein [Streptomyces]|uniref:quaternary amine ABC transporter ATP-binding protein n=1 Tax=Streptomyces TaxID=1883 RepID=UPI00287FD602|nr:betaine/proline/choline family ABC transporter ATP-binding protein [Streptomyces sp. CGMCC 4.1456]WNF66717.1 betaine/proline/choline family ABC transporter ATP-binding protein [Streptomyces sp. CGMCC 4.1456]
MIEASRLKKVFGSSADGVRAVDGVTFDVAPGELFVIMGLSGSGKSTLLRMLNRLVEPSSGTLRIEGRDVVGMGEAELRELRNTKINMVFQHFALFPHRTVRENAAYGMRIRGVDSAERLERADWALKTVGLGDRGDAYPDQLSGGQRQRVGLARALATDAEILLMDEPFSALDPLIRRDMQDLLLSLQRDLRRTIVFVTHDLNEAMRLGDRIMVMKDGRVVQLGTATDILHTPSSDYVRDFVSDVDRSRVLTASTIMSEPLMTADITEDPRQVLSRLSRIEAIGVFVLEGGHIAGVAHDGLLAQGVKEGHTSLHDCLTDDYEQTGPDTLLVDLCPRVGRHVVPLAVTDDDGKLRGVVPRAALLTALSDARTADSSDTPKEAAHV